MSEAAGKLLLLLECLGGYTEPVSARDLLGDSTSALWGNSLQMWALAQPAAMRSFNRKMS